MADDDGLPVKFGPVSNGEFHPLPHSPFLREVIRRTHLLADENARRLGISRRQFLTGITGAATTFFVLSACSNEKAKTSGTRPGGTFAVPESTTVDTGAAIDALGGDEFIFDVQSHYVNYDLAAPGGEWTSIFPQASCPEGVTAGTAKACFTADAYFREMFVRSDTSMAILSALPTPGSGLDPDDMAYAIDVATRVGCNGRVLMHGGAYPHRGPGRGGAGGHDRSAREVRHRGVEDVHDGPHRLVLLLRRSRPEPSAGRAALHRPRARDRPADHLHAQGAHRSWSAAGPSSATRATWGRRRRATPTSRSSCTTRATSPTWVVSVRTTRTIPRRKGVDRLVRSMQTSKLAPNSNVYAELGATWWYLMRDPTAAAHVLGKLLKYVGEDRVLWGTDSIWFGTPQDQIQALRTFEISEELQEKHGYPALTDDIKRKIFGLSAAKLYGITPITEKCDLTPAEIENIRASLPPARTYGPTTRTESAAMIAAHQAGRLA